MRGLWIESGSAWIRDDLPRPVPGVGESRIRVLKAGVCATDLALRRGYMAFVGVPGHEFVGRALDGPFAGERVVGEINAACGACPACVEGLGRHCPRRTVLGIAGRAGAFAEELTLPSENLHPVPAEVSSDAAVFVEPLAAAFEIGDQVRLEPGATALVAGDGRLGTLCAHVLHRAGLAVTVAGRHSERAGLLPPGVEHRVGLLESDEPWHAADPARTRFDLAVEATGRPETLARLLPWVRPRGTVVLKTTSETPHPIDTSPVVVHEITLVGSRCGRFAPALEALRSRAVPVERWIEARYPLEDALEAMSHAGQRGVLKVLIDVGD